MNDCAKQKPSMAQLSCIPNRVWRGLRWLVRCCSTLMTVLPGCINHHTWGYCSVGVARCELDPWFSKTALSRWSLSSFVKEASPALACTFCPKSINLSGRRASVDEPVYCIVCEAVALLPCSCQDCLQDGGSQNDEICPSHMSTQQC